MAAIFCGNCKEPLLQIEQPCSKCGSAQKLYAMSFQGGIKPAGNLDTEILLAWDGLALAVLGIFVTIVLTVGFGVWALTNSWVYTTLAALGSISLMLVAKI